MPPERPRRRRAAAVAKIAISARPGCRHGSRCEGRPWLTTQVCSCRMNAAAIAQTILVVDDEPQIRRAVRNALVTLSERVLEAASGAEGLDLAASGRPDL